MKKKLKEKRQLGKWRSWETTEGVARAPHRSMMRAMGLKDDDINAPFIGVASTHNEVTPCNSGIRPLAEEVKIGISNSKGTPFEFGTITVSDAISMGTEGMKGSLVSREIIADSIETVCFAERYDGLVAIAGCDKSLPGAMMAMARLDIPSVFVYGGSILPGHLNGEDLTIISAFEAVGKRQSGEINDEQLKEIEINACPGPGSCGGMFTANTMSSIGEALGLSLPGSASEAAVDQRKKDSSKEAGIAVMNLVRKNIRPSDILTKKAFENAITVVIALGGSTNAVLHLLAMASAANVKLKIEDFNRIGKKIPVIADLKPSGKHMMAKFCEIGGLPPLLKRLYDAKLLHGECLTVTGKTLKENLKNVKSVAATGVNRISVGSLTHSAPAIDFKLEF